MYRYTGFSLTFDSELELPELSEGQAEPEIVIRRGPVTIRNAVATCGDEIVSRPVARFRISGGCEIVVDARPDADPGAVRAALLGKVMAYLMRQRGWLPLHASAVEIHGSAALFLGHSGAGKSTTAAAFYSRGYPVLADDVGAVKFTDGKVLLHTTWSGLRLFDDALAVIGASPPPACFLDDKHVFHLDRRGSDVLIPVRRIYFLEYAGKENTCRIHAEVVGAFSAVALLNSNSYLDSPDAGDRPLQLNLERAASVASTVPVYRLFRPRSLRYLAQLVDFVEKDIHETGNTNA